jgi:hypothetical protein
MPANQPISSLTYTAKDMRDIDYVSSEFEKAFGSIPFFGPVFSPFFKDFMEFDHLNPEAHYHHH